jgi:hypothetical protein
MASNTTATPQVTKPNLRPTGQLASYDASIGVMNAIIATGKVKVTGRPGERVNITKTIDKLPE